MKGKNLIEGEYYDMNIIKNKNRKLVFLAIISLTMLLAIFSFSQTSHAATNGENTNKYPMAKELQKANDQLDSMTKEANKKLEEGEENFIIEEKIEGSDASVIQIGRASCRGSV